MKNPLYTLLLGAASLLALSACVQEQAPGDLNRDRVLMLRGDGMAIQRYEYCPGKADGEHRWHHRHHRRHHVTKDGAAPAKADVKKENVKKDTKSDKKDSK